MAMRYDIIQGPSEKNLVDSVFDLKSPVWKSLPFLIKSPGVSGNVPHPIFIQGMTKNTFGNAWVFKGYEPIDGLLVVGEICPKTRKGWIEF